MKQEKLWGGRFEASLESWVEEFGASIPFDYQLAPYDIKGSLAHVKMLGRTGIIAKEESQAIQKGLEVLLDKCQKGELAFSLVNEDIHMNIESFLAAAIGPVAGKLHTARSRNDQVATDLHLYLKDQIEQVLEKITALQEVLVKLADQHMKTIMPGYTHLQHAQPISFAHHLLAYYQMLKRDKERFSWNLEHTDMSPLGSAALAGTTFPIDRMETASTLGFRENYANSLDAVSDRDFVLEFLSNSSILMMHLSRFCEEIIHWCSHEYGFVSLSDSFSTGSSIMPQKKNPDMAELIRGKTGRVYGNLVGLLTVLKSLPLAYNKDLQEDKEGVFDTVKTVKTCLAVMAGMLDSMTVHGEKMKAATQQDFSNATELADYLAKKGIPFRKAHEIVGKLVLDCIKSGHYLQDVPLVTYQAISPLIEEDVYEVLDAAVAVEKRTSYGGTGFASVREQLQKAKKDLGE
ncbi:argininosuccinate lyase [Streptococcus pneumoniae]